MADLKTIVAQYQELSKEWGKGKNRDNAKVNELDFNIQIILISN